MTGGIINTSIQASIGEHVINQNNKAKEVENKKQGE
jgi:hypothetical protein